MTMTPVSITWNVHHDHHPHHHHHLLPIDADQEISLLESSSLSIGEHSDLAQFDALHLLMMIMIVIIIMILLMMMKMIVIKALSALKNILILLSLML